MPVIVENGTGLSNADSYISVADATTFLASRGKGDAWDAIDDKDAALRLATDYMLQKYRGRWDGQRKTTAQRLDWPRIFVKVEDAPNLVFGNYDYYYPDTQVPEEVKQACALLALRTADGSLSPDISRVVKSESVGPISVTYEDGSSPNVVFSEIGMLLRPYLRSASMLKVSRA